MYHIEKQCEKCGCPEVRAHLARKEPKVSLIVLGEGDKSGGYTTQT